MRWLLNIAFITFSFSAYSQTKGDVELKTFFAVTTNSTVELKWVISAGFTCNGTEIYWSQDSINFERVGGIAGLCGSVSSSVSYDFTHKSPSSNTLNYYRLELGTNGDSQTISTFFVDLAAETYLAIPNPANEIATIYFRNNSNRKIDFTLFNISGHQVYSNNEIYDSKVQLDVSSYTNGYYYFVISAENSNPIKGKILVQH